MAGLNNPVGSQVRDLCSLNEDNIEWPTSWLSKKGWGCTCLYTGLPAILGRLWYAIYTHHQVLIKSLDSHTCSSLLFMMEVMVLTLGNTSYKLTHCHVIYEVFLLSFLCNLSDNCYLKIWKVKSTKWFLRNHVTNISFSSFAEFTLLEFFDVRRFTIRSSRNIFATCC